MASIRKMRNKWYARIVWRVSGKLKEILIPLKTSSLTEARTRLKLVENQETDIVDGIIQKFQFNDIFRWLNPEGTSRFTSLKLSDVIPEFLKYRRCVVRKSTTDRDVYALKQLTKVLGNKIVQEITYKDIEEKFIPYYQKKGCQNGGINISLRIIKVLCNYLLKEKLIDEKITFKMLPIDDEPCYINRAEINALYEIVDEKFRRWFCFYELVGCRAKEPFLHGFLDGNVWKISPEEAKTKHWHYYQLTDELKYIWMELQDLKQSYIDKGKNETQAQNTCYQLLQKNMWRAIVELKKSGVVPKEKKLTLKSFRHTFGIINVVKTKDIWGTSKKMNHKEIGVTQRYLDIEHYIIEQDFPELKPYLDLVDNTEIFRSEATPPSVNSPYAPMGSVLGADGYELMDTHRRKVLKS